MVRRLTSRYTALWFNASGNPPLFLQRFTRSEQHDREKRINALRRHEPHSRKRIMAFIAREIPGRGGARLRGFLDDCGKTGEKFAARARTFDPNLPEAEIQQALRNLWVFNSIQFYLGKRVALTPSAFAYSLVYPYTDNCLDGQEETLREKHAFLRWLSLQLSGHPEPADDRRKAVVAALLAAARASERFPVVEWFRKLYPMLYVAACYREMSVLIRSIRGTDFDAAMAHLAHWLSPAEHERAIGQLSGGLVLGLEDDAAARAVQDGFVSCGAAQCGICTPGMVLAAVSLLRRHEHPTDDQIREGLSGNLCRCTGYMRIFEAVSRGGRVPRVADTADDVDKRGRGFRG